MPAPRTTALVVASLVAVVASATACDTGDGKEMRPPTSDQRTAMTTTTSTSTTLPGASLPALVSETTTTTVAAPAPFSLELPWLPGGAIDIRFTCDGEDRSPVLVWSAPPPGTVEMALVVTDDDADGFVHWAVAGIPATAGEVGEGGQITGALEGRNGFGEPGWGGPCPPVGDPHTYRFTLYALSQQAELPEDFGGDDLLAVAGSANIAVAQSTGTYSRAG